MARERRTPAERQDEVATPAVNPGALGRDHPYVVALTVGCFRDPSAPHDERDYSLPGLAAAAKAAK
jgi:hypothetical protein